MHAPPEQAKRPAQMAGAVGKSKRTVFMMDLLATVPYYTAYLSSALLAEGLTLTVGSIFYYLDPGCFSTRGIALDPGLLNIVGRYPLPRMLRRGLKLIEAMLNMAALAVRFLIRPPSLIHVQYLPMLRWALPLDWLLVCLGRLRGAKVVLTVHDLLPHDSADEHTEIFSRVYRRVDGIICHSDHVKDRLTTEFELAAPGIWVIPHGPFFYDLPPESLEQAQQTRLCEPDERVVLWQGIIFPYKGLDTLLDAWQSVEAEVPGARLVVVGTGAPYLLEQVRAQAARLRLGRVTLLLRFASTAELVAIYREADVVVYPYREITTSGALATGLALGKAIVASDLPVFRELLTSGRDALLVPPDRPAELATAIVTVLKDEEMRQSFLSAVTRKDFGSQSWVSIARRTLQVYDAVLSLG